ncbi:MAG: hypothetical protein WCZ16_02700, partial [Desulfosarcinaceae bacterium]
DRDPALSILRRMPWPSRNRTSFFQPECLAGQKAAKALIDLRRLVQHDLKPGESIRFQGKKSLAEQYVFRLAASRFQHELGSAAAEALRRLVNQIALFGFAPDIDGNRCCGR